MANRLDPLLRPKSIAVLGATQKQHSVGRQTMENLQRGGYPGNLYAVNPGYDTVLTVPCYASLSASPQTVELVIFTIVDQHVEAALNDVVYAMPPFNQDVAARMIAGLREHQLVEFDRGAGRPDMDFFCRSVALFSVMVASLGDAIAEIDMNRRVSTFPAAASARTCHFAWS